MEEQCFGTIHSKNDSEEVTWLAQKHVGEKQNDEMFK